MLWSEYTRQCGCRGFASVFRLLTCDDDVWMEMLDDLDFWKIGWRPFAEEESEN